MYYVYHDFSKADKKKLLALITVSVQREIDIYLKKSLLEHQEIVLKQHEDIRKPFWAYKEKLDKFAKYLTRTYDNWSHRDVPLMIARFIHEEILLKKDIEDFSAEGQEKLLAMVESMK